LKVTLEVNRRKDQEEIVETFSVNPKWSKAFDRQLSLYYALWKLSHDMGIGEDYRLIERKEFSNHIINVYEYEKDKPVPKLNDRFEFVYIPHMGSKKCSRCIHKRLLKDNNEYCKVRGKKLKKDYWHKCDYWQEIFQGHNVKT
jgi:hypothetical protein